MKARFLLVASALLTGCSAKVTNPPPPEPPIPSSTQDVSQMTPSFSAQSDGTNIHVFAALLGRSSAPNSGFVELDAGDSFTATLGGTTLPLTIEPSPSDNHIHYTATFPAPQGPASVAIAFQRTNGMTSAPSSTIEVAAPFEVAALPSSFHRGDPLAITLSPAVSPLPESPAVAVMTLEFQGSCMPTELVEYPLQLSATGTASFDTSQVTFADEQGKGPATSPLECDITVHVRADTHGGMDPAFKQGDLEGLQERLVASHIVR